MKPFTATLAIAISSILISCQSVNHQTELGRPPVIHNRAVGPWTNVHQGDASLAGTIVQQFTDCPYENQRWEGKHPAMVLFVFWDGKVRQRGYQPDGTCYEDFYWNIPSDSHQWDSVDFTTGSDPYFHNHRDPRRGRS